MQIMFFANFCFQMQHSCVVLQNEQIFSMNVYSTNFVATTTTFIVMIVLIRFEKIRIVFNCVSRNVKKRKKMLTIRKINERLRFKFSICIICENCCNFVYETHNWHDYRNATNLNYLQNAIKLIHCDDENYCCDIRNTTCCVQNHNKRIANIIVNF